MSSVELEGVISLIRKSTPCSSSSLVASWQYSDLLQLRNQSLSVSPVAHLQRLVKKSLLILCVDVVRLALGLHKVLGKC